MREIESSGKIFAFSRFFKGPPRNPDFGGKLKEDKVRDIRLIAYANAPHLMDVGRDKWEEG